MLLNEIQKARRSMGWSQKTLANRIGADAQTIKRLEKGIGSLASLIKAMQALEFQLAGVGPGRTVPEQLRNRREKLSLSVNALAVKSGMSRATIKSIENGAGTIASVLKLLAILAPKAKRRAPERVYWSQAAKLDRDSRFTPASFMEHVYSAFGPVDLDPCAHEQSPVIARRKFLLSDGDDGLRDEWTGSFAFVNPPYSDQLTWLKRAYHQWNEGNIRSVMCLVPFRPDSKFFHDTVMKKADIFALQGRVKFEDISGKAQATPFSLAVIVFGATSDQKAKFADLMPGSWLNFA
ncbi:MAG: DNA N-6-adenine-methyltransferase [Pontixanthobacter sp.]